MPRAIATAAPVGYLGPAGSWIHQACIDSHVSLIGLAGHAAQEPLKSFLDTNAGFDLLGSYPRRH